MTINKRVITPALKKRFITYLHKHSTVIIVCLFSIINFLYIYWSDPARPGALYKDGWYEIWSDQRYYAIIARKLFLLDFTASGYEYPLGYPLLGAFSYRFFPQDTFLLPDLFLYSLSTIFFYLINIKLFKKKQFAVFLTIILLLSGTFNRSVTPWTTNVTLTLSIISFYILLQKFSIRNALLISFFCGYSFFTRYSDSLILLPLLLVYSLKLIIKKNQKYTNKFLLLREYLLKLIFILLPFLLLITVTFLINRLIFGNYLGNYLRSVKNEGFDSPATWVNKTIGMLFNSWIYHRETHLLSIPVIKENLILVFFPLGGFLFIKDNWKKQKLFIVAISASLTIWLFLYIPFIAISPWDLKFGNARYINSIFTVLIIFSSYILIRSIVKPLNTLKYLIIYLLIFTASLYFISVKKPIPINNKNIDYEIETSSNQLAAKNIIDNNKDTRWDTGKPRSNNDYLIINFNKIISLRGIELDTQKSPSGCANSYIIETSTDKTHWKIVAEIKGESYCYVVDKYFYPTNSKYVKIRLTEKTPTNEYWSVHEITFFQ